MRMKTKPFDHQLECFNLMKDEPYYGLFAEPGLGKTKIVLDILSYNKEKRVKKGRGISALVVCPNTLVENWMDEVIKHSDLRWVMVYGTPFMKRKRLDDEGDVHIINYEALRKPEMFKFIMRKKFDYLILDESTAVKNPRSQQSKACVEIADSVKRKIIMSGTPVMNSPLDIFAQYKVLDRSIFGHNFYRFRNRYAVMGGYMNKQAIGWKNMESFKMRVFSCAVRKTKDECLDLPDKLYQVVNLDMTEEQAAIYQSLKKEFIYEFRDVTVTAPIMLTRLMRFSQITAGFTKDVEGIEHDFKKNPKVDWLIEFIANLPLEAKVVVFCRFRRENQNGGECVTYTRHTIRVCAWRN